MSILCSRIPTNGGLPIPEEVRPRKDQPFYHLYAENADTEYVAYVSEQNLLPDTSGDPSVIRRSKRCLPARTTADIASRRYG